MGRTRIVGLLAFALVALGVTGASAASAAAPQWSYCGKAVPKNSGAYSDKNCSVAAEPGHGKYEILSGEGKKPIKGKATGRTRVIVAIPALVEVHIDCEKASFTGHPTGASGITQARFGFSKCHWQEGACDAVETEALSGHLGWLNAGKGEAGLSLTSEKLPGTGLIAEFNCEEGVKFRITGAFIVGIGPTGGGLSKSHTLTGEVGEYLGEPSPGDKPVVNPPAFEEEAVGTLQTEYAGPETEGELEPEGGIPSGLEGAWALTGEALAID